MSRTPIHTDDAPVAIGTYSQAIRAGDMIYISGQIPLEPESGELVRGDIRAQIEQVFDNLAAIAAGAGSSLHNAVKITVYLTDLGNFGAVNETMAQYFEQPYPARAAVQIAGLPLGAAVEADAILTA